MRSARQNATIVGMAVAAFCCAVSLDGFAQGNAAPQTPVAPPASLQGSAPLNPTQGSLQGQLVVLDHVVAVINGDVILESDVQEEMRFAVLQPDRADPARNTPQAALQRLIDRDLILQQMKLIQMTPADPTPEQVNQQLSELRRQIPECPQYRCETEEGWRAFLKADDLTPAEVEAHWKERMLILSFIQARFGAGVRVSQAETEDYYNKNFAPAFAKKNLKPPPLKTVATRIQEILLQQRVNSFLREWLQSLKDEGNVSILGAAYSDVGKPETPATGAKP